MCAINGFTWQDQDTITAMNNITKHRGPDDSGVFCDDGISLGHNRLSIIDLSQKAHQPMKTEDGRFVISYNGELYNFKELKKELITKGVQFNSESDTEVILKLYQDEGVGMLEKLIGIFAIAIWDNHKKELFLVRDHFGIKPLYYHYDGARLIFSSEAKALFEHNISKDVDPISLNNYLRFLYCVGPRTMWQHVKKMPAGSYGIYKDGSFQIKKYFTLKTKDIPEKKHEIEELIRGHVREAVKSQLISDRPVGIFLSGGLDSSIVAAIMAQEASGRINSFSVGFDTKVNPEKFNADFKIAAQTAKHFGFDHHEVVISNQDMRDNLEDCIYSMDEPVSNPIQVATYLLAKKAKQDVAVVLGGDGGDELFGGYDRYYYYRMLDRIQKIAPFVKNKTNSKFIAKMLRKPDLARKLQSEPGLDRFFTMMAQKEEILRKFVKPGFNNGILSIGSYKQFFDNSLEDPINKMMWADTQTWLADESLIRSDKLTMAHGLEQRVPLLDPRVVELAYSIPSHHKLHSKTEGKKIYKDAFAPMLPEFVLEQKKRGFFSPTAKWLREDPLKSYIYEILSPSYCPQTADWFDWDAIKKITDDHINFKGYALNTIWSIVTLQIWAKKFLN